MVTGYYYYTFARLSGVVRVELIKFPTSFNIQYYSLELNSGIGAIYEALIFK